MILTAMTSNTRLSCVKAFDTLQNIDDIVTFGIRNIRKEDLDWAKANHRACKLIGTGAFHGDFISACVIPMFLHEDDVFSNIPLNFNAIESRSKTLGSATFVGQGAGSLPTAHAVVQNLVDIWKNQDPEINDKFNRPIDNTLHTGVFYIRTKKTALFADIIDRRISEDAFLTRKISLVQAAMAIHSAVDDTLFIAEVAE